MSASVPWDALQAAASEERAQAVLDLADAVAELTKRLGWLENVVKALDAESKAWTEIRQHVAVLGVDCVLEVLGAVQEELG